MEDVTMSGSQFPAFDDMESRYLLKDDMRRQAEGDLRGRVLNEQVGNSERLVVPTNGVTGLEDILENDMTV